MKKIILILSIIVFYTSCKRKETHESYFKTEKIILNKAVKFNLKLDSVTLPKINCSYAGDIAYLNDKIQFIDYRFCLIFSFDYKGNFISKNLGQGRGKNEVNMGTITKFDILDNGNYVFYGHANDVHVYDKNYNLLAEQLINWNSDIRYGEARFLSNLSPDEPTLYSFDFINNKIKHHNNTEYISIYSEHKDFNGFNTQKYYTESRILAEIDLSDLSNINVSRILGRRTNKLLQYSYLPHHSSFTFDIDNSNNFYIAHEIDPLIYVYDKDFNVKYAFGVEGQNMDTRYQELKNFDVIKFRELFFIDRNNRGYYSDIKIFNDVIFRSYKKGNNCLKDGLQIYKENTLVADIEVPKNFEVRFYKDGFFYSNLTINEEKEKMSFYKFKIPTE